MSSHKVRSVVLTMMLTESRAFLHSGTPKCIARSGRALVGDHAGARKVLEDLKQESKPPHFLSAFACAGIHALLGEKDAAFEWLDKARQGRAGGMVYLRADWAFNVTGELDKAALTAQETIQNYARGPYLLLGGIYENQGLFENATESYYQYLRLCLDDVEASGNLLNSQLALQRFDEARQTLQQAPARKSDNLVVHNALYALAFLASDSAAMSEQQQWFADKPQEENTGLSLASDTEAYAGHLRRARELTKRSIDSALRVDSKESGAMWYEIAAQREAAFGNKSDAKQVAALGLKLDQASQGVEAEAALAFALADDMGRAESLVEDLSKRFPLDTQVQLLDSRAAGAQQKKLKRSIG
jgi:tetratricopeptide (TPR) repeat protein